MAKKKKKFKFKGLKDRPGLVKKKGRLVEIRIPRSDGTMLSIQAEDPAVGIKPNDIVTLPDTDPLMELCMQDEEHFEFAGEVT